ncbi:MAG TPA: L,D-transpeptidase family protein, partial [Armatimonadota bacterium]|nr:L,D-transpeptidase family protein [Armatimonadota bacterium]
MRSLLLAGAWVLIAGLTGVAGRTAGAGTQDAPAPASTLKGVTFTDAPETLYIPARELGEALGLPVGWSSESNEVLLDGQAVPAHATRRLPDRSAAIEVRALEEQAFRVRWDPDARRASVYKGETSAEITQGERTVSEGVTFAEDPDRLFALAAEAGDALGLTVDAGSGKKGELLLEGKPVPSDQRSALVDGTSLLDLSALEQAGAAVSWKPELSAAQVTREERELWVLRGPKRVQINRKRQRMRAWQGRRRVLETRVSTGRPGMETPTGSFAAGPLKSPMLISRKYTDAKMPWSVQVRGDVVIHGYSSVPPHAASHGCIRVPLTGANPAKWFYHWVDVGTPIRI